MLNQGYMFENTPANTQVVTMRCPFRVCAFLFIVTPSIRSFLLSSLFEGKGKIGNYLQAFPANGHSQCKQFGLVDVGDIQ
jgi:hypothetical protein